MLDTDQLDPDVIAILQDGRKIEAIKRLRENRGIGLKEAKDLVERYEATMPGRDDHVVKVKSNNGFMVIIFIAILVYVAYQWLE